MRPKLLLTLIIAFLLLAAVPTADAHRVGYSLTWWTVDGGGGAVNNGQYALYGTIGQADAGALSGGIYHLTGGFQTREGQLLIHHIFLPAIIR
jgi:hypothetical protein